MAEYVRLIGRQAQTAVRRYSHPDTDRRVTLIGTYHFGESTYFEGLRRVIDGLEMAGAAVHCEGIGWVPDDDRVTAEQQQLWADMRRCAELDKRRMADLGWTTQIEGLGYPPQWSVVDLSASQTMRRIDLAAQHKIVQRKIASLDWPDEDRRGIHRFARDLALQLQISANDRYMIALSRRDGPEATLLGDRNKVALAGVAGTDQNLVLIWGAGHLPGLDAGLREQGFVYAGEPEWHTIAQVPSISRALFRLIFASGKH